MSQQLISRNDDLRRLQAEGYTIEIVGGNLVVRDVPFVDSGSKVHDNGFLVMPLTMAGETTRPPSDHTASFGGGIPCTSTGADLSTVVNNREERNLGGGLIVNAYCSMKPVATGGKYSDFYEKVTKYVAAIAGHAQSVDPSVKICRFRPIPNDSSGSPFKYLNTASSRAGIDALNAVLRTEVIGIVGVGGSGGYVVDYTSKTEVAQIHLFDGDDLFTHNAFRAPGAVSVEVLNACPKKVDYFAAVYGVMRDGIVAHSYDLDPSNVEELAAMTFVFIAVDDPVAKKPIIDFLVERRIPFVDVGMGVEVVDGRLTGSVRTTTVTPEKGDHIDQRISVAESAVGDEYRSNIQIVELNARNAADAVVAWKKYRGFYADLSGAHHSVYTIATNHTINCDHLDGQDGGAGS